MLRRTFLLSAALLLPLAAPLRAADREPIKVLIITGDHGHDWKSTTPHMKKWLEASGKFTVDVATSPAKPQPPVNAPDAPKDAAKYSGTPKRLAVYAGRIHTVGKGTITDGVILVVSAGKTLREEAKRAAKQIKNVDGQIIGAIVNAIEPDSRSGYYYSYYGYAEKSPAPQQTQV